MPTILRHHSGLIFKGPQRINSFFDIPTLENDTIMLSQNVTASKAMPHPRIKTSSSLKFPLFHLSNNHIPNLSHTHKCNWTLSQPLTFPARCSYSITHCSTRIGSLIPTAFLLVYNKTPLLPCSSFLLKSSEPEDGSSKLLWNPSNYLAFNMVPYTWTLGNIYVKLYVNMQVLYTKAFK